MEALAGKRNKAIVIVEPGTCKTEVVERPIESPGAGQVLVRLWYTGVCHSDYSFCTGGFSNVAPKGHIGGHEGIGEVVAQGPGVVSPPIGSRVGVKFIASACLSCRHCLRGAEASCAEAPLTGFTVPGTFQQYCLATANYVTVLPPDVPDDLLPGLAPLMCAGLTVYAGLKRAEARPGDWVVVTGAGGGLGHLAVQYAKVLGARVLALDGGDKKDFCESLGVDVFVDFTAFATDADLCSRVKTVTGGGAQVVIACSGSNRAYGQAMGYLDDCGTLVCIGIPEGAPTPISGALPGAIALKQWRIIGSKVGNRLDASECIDIAARGLVKTHFQLRKMEELSEIFEEMRQGKIKGRVVIDLR
ncbi:hypothetical protein VTO42DRAFT_2472 [Malbranchea cinnamomea]